MNLFLLSIDPHECAKWHCDQHVGKMILETCQMLYTAHWINNPEACKTWNAPETLKGDSGYKKLSNHNHPMAIWVRKCRSNYNFACKLALCLSIEFVERYGHTHASTGHAIWLVKHPPSFPDGASLRVTPIPQCMPEEYKCTNPVLAYRRYYLGDKARFATWKRASSIPPWWENNPM